LGELTVGTEVAVPRVLPAFGTAPLRECAIKLLAYLIGDGGLTQANPILTNLDPRQVADFSEAAAQFGGLKVTRTSDSDGDAFERLCAELHVEPARLAPEGLDSLRKNDGNALVRWLRELGLWGKGSAEKFVPECVFTLPRAQLALFLNRL